MGEKYFIGACEDTECSTEQAFGSSLELTMTIQRRAGDGIRTHDNHVGNVVLYQLSYTRMLLFSEIRGINEDH